MNLAALRREQITIAAKEHERALRVSGRIEDGIREAEEWANGEER